MRELVRAHRCDFHFVEPARKRQEPVDDFFQAIGFRSDDGEALGHLRVGRVARHVRRKTLDRGERVLHLVRHARRDRLEGARAVRAFVAKFFAARGELERHPFVEERHVLSHQVHADHDEHPHRDRRTDVHGGREPECTRRLRGIGDGSARREHHRDERDQKRAEEDHPNLLRHRQERRAEQHGDAHDRQGARAPAGVHDARDEKEHSGQKALPMIGLARVPHAVHERRHGQKDGAYLQREARRSRAVHHHRHEHDDADEPPPREPPALPGERHFPEHLPTQRIEAFAIAQVRGCCCHAGSQVVSVEQTPCPWRRSLPRVPHSSS